MSPTLIGMPSGKVTLSTVSSKTSPLLFAILTFANKPELSDPQASYSSTWILHVLVVEAGVAGAVREGAVGRAVPLN